MLLIVLTYFTLTQETVSGTVALLSKVEKAFHLDVEQVVMKVTGSIMFQNRQNKPELDDLAKRVPPMSIINIPNLVLAKDKTVYYSCK